MTSAHGNVSAQSHDHSTETTSGLKAIPTFDQIMLLLFSSAEISQEFKCGSG